MALQAAAARLEVAAGSASRRIWADDAGKVQTDGKSKKPTFIVAVADPRDPACTALEMWLWLSQP